MELSVSPKDNTTELKYHGLYIWLLNLSDESDQYFLAEENDNHHQSGPLAWKLNTTNILRSVKQVISRAQNMIHTLYLEIINNKINALVKDLKWNLKLLVSCGESEPSILANLFRVLKKSPSSEFNTYIGQFQDKYDDGTNTDIDDFMRDIVVKYKSLVEGEQRDIKPEKYAEILGLTS